MAMMLQDKAVEAAKKGWESGRCVVLEPTTSPGKRTGLKPSTAVTITAAPRSKIDGAATGGTVTATLNGASSVDPAGSKVPADATFAYVAPGEKDKSATVALEARSKRGVAKASVAFDTKAGGFALKGSIPTAPGGTRITGATCDVTQPFTAESSGDMVGTITFTPTDDVSGKVAFKGRVGQCPAEDHREGHLRRERPAGVRLGHARLDVVRDHLHPARQQDGQRTGHPHDDPQRHLLTRRYDGRGGRQALLAQLERGEGVDDRLVAAAPGAGRVVGDAGEHVQRLPRHRAQGEQVEVLVRVDEPLGCGGAADERRSGSAPRRPRTR